MTKETKEESLDLFEFDKKQNQKHSQKRTRKSSNVRVKDREVNKKKNNKVKNQETKDEKFNFDEEIIIGLKKIDNGENQLQEKKNSKRKNASVSQPKKLNDKNYMEKRQNSSQRKREKEPKELSAKQLLAKKKREAVFKVIKWTTLVAIIIGGCIYTLLSPIFNVKTINVIGNAKIATDEIISLSQIELEQNMFQYHKRELIKKIKENAYIDQVQIVHKIPDTIEITVVEREASFKIQVANAYALVNNQGYILEITNRKEELPIITGVQTIPEEIQVGSRICIEDLEKLGDVLQIMESATSNGLNKSITKIDITDSNNYILTLEKKKKIVHLGDTSNLSTKMLWILKINELQGDTKGEIILNMNLNSEQGKPIFRRTI